VNIGVETYSEVAFFVSQIIGNATSERFWPHFYRENIGNKKSDFEITFETRMIMNIGTCLHAYIIENEGV
jgi:hypothetical protein